MNIDLSILRKTPSLTESVTMFILPLAPLSMVADMPGSFYKTLRFPNKKMLCGVMENALGWHLSVTDRKGILNDYKKLCQKTHIEVQDSENGSTYIPLLMDYFEIHGRIELQKFKSVIFYKDLWNKSYRRADSYKHINGCRNISIDVIKEYYHIFKDSNEETKGKWFKNNIGKVPFFYSSPTNREYIHIDGAYCIPLIIDLKLAEKLRESISENNMCYLGTSEGWIDISLI